MKNTKILLITLLSMSLISLELVWTRVFSAEFFYTFAFLILSLAILGLGLGALTLRLFEKLNKESYLGFFLSITGLMILIAPPAVFRLGLQFSQLYHSWAMVGKFILTLILLNSSFYFGGIALAILFRNNHKEMPKLYMADLIGAGVGILIIVQFMNWFSTPSAVFLSAIPVLIAAIISSPKILKALPAILLVIVFVMSNFSSTLLKSNRKDRIPTIYEHWDATSKVRIGTYGDDDMYRNIEIDHAANTPVARFDGNWDRPDSLKFEFDMDVSYLINRFKSRTFLALGAGGGQEVMQALQNNIEEVHAVEVIPHINELMITGELADFTGRIYHDPRVTVATEDARAYVRRFDNKFDIIFSSSSNSWAALASGSFALAENYLFTTEAFEDYWNAMTDNGFLIMEHQIYMPRLVSEVIDALENMDIPNARDHFAVYSMPNRRRHILLFSKQLLTDDIRANAFAPAPKQASHYKHLVYPAVDSLKGNLINQIVENGWESASEKAVIDISPATDNKPFVAQLGLWKNFSFKKLERVSPIEFNGFPLTKMNIIIILLIVVALIIPLNFIPYLKKGDKLKAVPWLYFFLIGMAFMVVEITLMQKYTLFIGPSIYSLITILLTLLIFSGIGSRFSDKIDTKIAFGGIILWLMLDIFIFKFFFTLFGGLTMFPRILISALLIAPLGFFMGIPFPKAALKVGPLVDWGFAVNGAASVLGSTLVVLIVFNFGFSVALRIGALLYLAAFWLITKEKSW